jgi:hypothetical protein
MIDPAAALSAAQREYDEVEERLLRKLPEFRHYLAVQDPDDRRQYEQAISTDPEFRRWQRLAAEIAKLHEEQGKKLR